MEVDGTLNIEVYVRVSISTLFLYGLAESLIILLGGVILRLYPLPAPI